MIFVGNCFEHCKVKGQLCLKLHSSVNSTGYLNENWYLIVTLNAL